MLLRAFIRRSLAAYFSRPSSPVGVLPKPLDLASLAGEPAYREAVRQAYDSLGNAWLTPSELLTPHYGRALAQWLLRDWQQHGGALRIVEVGGGTGRLARDILDTLTPTTSPTAITYTLIEPSPVLADLQRTTTHPHRDRVTIVQRDALDDDAFCFHRSPSTPTHTVLLMAEVLDNLPHDRVVYNAYNTPHAATCVDADHLTESLTPLAELADPLIDAILPHLPTPWWPSIPGLSPNMAWLPTGALKLFENARRGLGAHTVLALDFDHLPDVVLAGRNAPLVSDTRQGQAVDASTYLLPPGSADILFPTDFGLLARVLQGQGYAATSCKVAALLRAMPGVGAAATRSGWNPLLDDFSNTSALIAHIDDP